MDSSGPQKPESGNTLIAHQQKMETKNEVHMHSGILFTWEEKWYQYIAGIWNQIEKYKCCMFLSCVEPIMQMSMWVCEHVSCEHVSCERVVVIKGERESSLWGKKHF